MQSCILSPEGQNQIRSCILLVLCHCFTGVFAQFPEQIYHHLTTRHGLSSDKIEAVIQSRDGFYWIATQNGLNRFDGTQFRVYHHHSGDSTTLSHNYCTALAEDKYGDIWIATHKGVSKYVRKEGKFRRYYFRNPYNNFELSNRIQNIVADNKGNVWVSGSGLWSVNISSGVTTFFDGKKGKIPSPSPYTFIKHIVYDSLRGGLWFTGGNTLNFYSDSTKQIYTSLNNPLGWKAFDYADAAELTLDSDHRLWFRDEATQHLAYFDFLRNKVSVTGVKIDKGVRQIKADDQNRVWLLYWLSPAEIYDSRSDNVIRDIFSTTASESSASGEANSVYIDGQRNYWIATGHGIFIYNEIHQYYHSYELKLQTEKKVPLRINALAQNDPSYVWLGTNYGLFRYHLESGIHHRVNYPSQYPSIHSLCADRDKIWVGAYDHILCIDAKTEMILKKILLQPGFYFLIKGDHHDLWAGMWNKGLYRIDLISGNITHFTKNDNQHSLKSDNLITGLSDGDVFWLGYNGGAGFSKLDLRDNTFMHYHPASADTSSSTGGTITVITKGMNEVFWLGTHGGGLFEFNPVTDRFIHYQQQDGMNSNYINSIQPDKYNNLWISTADGVNYMNARTKSIADLKLNLVFPNNDFLANGMQGMNGKLYFFCKNQFIEINPEAYHPVQSFPRILISSIKIFDREIPPGDLKELNLSYKENFFSFEFSSIRPPQQNVNYAYMLEGFDKDWVIAGTKGYAPYTNVPEGKYVFKIKATNNEGVWSDPLIDIELKIRPPFWRTWWFISLCAVNIGMIAWLFHRYRISQVKKIYSLRTQISRDLHDDIGASLSSINIYSNLAESEVAENPQRAKEILNQISTNSREVMENISDIVWANHTNRHAGASLAGRIKNYGYDLLSQKNIDCAYHIDPNVDKKLSSPEARRSILLIIKEALNNITKYSEASEASLHISLNGHSLNIRIYDNGKGFDKNALTKGNGLHNMEQRAMALGGKLIISSLPGHGTTIDTSIPLANISD